MNTQKNTTRNYEPSFIPVVRKELKIDNAEMHIKLLPKVENMRSAKGNFVPNQHIIQTDKGLVFQSHNTIIAFKSLADGKVYLDTDMWDCSVTTGKYRNQFLGENKKETERRIKEGDYVLADLNL